jgi:hypothetical protein
MGGMAAILLYKKSTITDSYLTIANHPFYTPYSPHAWLGTAFMGSWIFQCLGRLFPSYISSSLHQFSGRVLYVSGLVCCALGLQQQQTRQLMSKMIDQDMTSNCTNATSTIITTVTSTVTTWWFSQPSLAVMLLGIAGIATFYVGL